MSPKAHPVMRHVEVTPTTPAARSTTQLARVAIERFDDYVIVAKIGQGGMAEVFLALEQGPGAFRKLLVVKRLHAHMADDPHAVRMFMREATLAARLHHPNVVQTNKVGQAAGQPFLAMEYLEGQPLHRIVQRLAADGRTLAPELAARIAVEVLQGLAYAHELRDYDDAPLAIVHRDVSPQNVFVTYDGQVKLLDFGIAKAALGDAHTRAGLIKGKFSYIAPEQARGDGVDARADLWSVGVTLWECLTGERPFRGSNEVAVLRSVLTDELPSLRDLECGVPDELATIVDHALQREPEQRHASARAFRSELLSYLRFHAEDDARSGLAALMDELFADKLVERRETVRRCVAQVAQDDPALPPAAGAVVSLVPAPRRVRPAGVLLVLALVAALAVTFALVTEPEPAALEPMASVQTAPPAAQPAVVPHRERAVTTQPSAPPPAPPAVPKPRKLPPRQPAPPVRQQAPAVVEAAPEVVPAKGVLALDSAPYAIVSLDGVRLGITPLEVELPATTHTLSLRNPELGIETTYRVTVPSGQRIARRIALE